MASALIRLVAERPTGAAMPITVATSNVNEGARRSAVQVLPVTHFGSVDDVERIANELELAAIAGPIFACDEMFGIFYELGLNAVQHSESAVGTYVISECEINPSGMIVHTLGVADCGIGIPTSLRRNPVHADVLDDTAAIALATKLHVTGTGEAHRGLGLDHVFETVKLFRGHCIIVSGTGQVEIVNGDGHTGTSTRLTDHLSGTVVSVTMAGPQLR